MAEKAMQIVKKRWTEVGRWLLLGLIMLLMQWAQAENLILPKGESLNCQRIVSISPAISDILVDLKLADNVIGATRYCKLPEKKERELVGGYFDLNIEKVMSLQPDIVFLEGMPNNPISQRLDSLGIKNRTFALDTLDEMEGAKQEIGHYCEGEIVIDGLTLKEFLAHKVPQNVTDHPKVLILYNYGESSEKILPRLAAGRSFHGELLETLGMENVYLGSLNAPELTREAISLLNPEWIFILNGLITEPEQPYNVLEVQNIHPKWEFLSGVKAVQQSHVYEIRGFYTQIPSVAAMEQLGEILSQLVYGDQREKTE